MQTHVLPGFNRISFPSLSKYLVGANCSSRFHVISAALVNTVAERDTQGYYAKLAAGGFHSTTRISSSSPEMWENICQTNREKIVEFLEEYIDTLSKAKEDIISGDSQAITKLFADAKKYRDSIPT